MSDTEPRTAAHKTIADFLAWYINHFEEIPAKRSDGVLDRECNAADELLRRLATIAPTEPRTAAQIDVPRLVDELEEAHSRLSETFHIFGEGAETDRQRGYYREAKARLIAATIAPTEPRTAAQNQNETARIVAANLLSRMFRDQDGDDILAELESLGISVVYTEYANRTTTAPDEPGRVEIDVADARAAATLAGLAGHQFPVKSQDRANMFALSRRLDEAAAESATGEKK